MWLHSGMSLFDSIGGLPLHPLVVHFAVVLLPLSALALVAIVLVPRWRRPFGWVVMAGLLVGAGASVVAKETGEALAATVGTPQRHADLGDVLPLVAMLLLVLGAVWFWLQRRASAQPTTGRSWPVLLTGIASILVAAGAVLLTILVGHSGAQAVWEGEAGRIATNATNATSAPSATAQPALTLAEVARHGTATDCWTVVSGNVYDVTSWIDQHPGGSAVIEQMCGTDATSAFEGQHQGQGRPNDELAAFLLGPLAASAS
jgi:hypothetical protein